jgi:hypothetical protein
MTQWGLDSLFNPAKRHMDEEKQRLQSTREQIGDSSGGKRIDLESGKVTISRGPAKDDGSEADETEGDDGATEAAAETVDDPGQSVEHPADTADPTSDQPDDEATDEVIDEVIENEK